VANRPEKLLIASLERLMEVKNQPLKLVDYHPDTVWLELANGEVDLVIAPIGEAVKAQGRFQAGRFLFFTGESVGLDKLLAAPKASSPKQVATLTGAATDFLARQMLPEARIVPANSMEEVETWLKGGAVEAAMINSSITAKELIEKYKILAETSSENPMPTVAVLSKPFADNAGTPAYAERREVLEAALESWAGLVSYLDTQPELLRSTLQKDAAPYGVDVNQLLADYRFLAPGPGRSALEAYARSDALKETLDLLVLSGVDNLSAPDWQSVVEVPATLMPAFSGNQVSTIVESPSDPLVAESPTPSLALTASPTPGAEVTPQINTPDRIPSSVEAPPTHTYPDDEIPSSWPTPILEYSVSQLANYPPALSAKRVAVASENMLYLNGWNKEAAQVPLESSLTTAPLSDGRNFFYAVNGKIVAVNAAGKTVWEEEVKGQPLGASEVVNERLFYALDEGERGRIICLDPVDGERLWEVVLPSPPTTGPVAGGSPNVVAVADEKGTITAVDFATGQQKWKLELGEPTYIPLAIGYEHLAVLQPSGQVHLYSLTAGEEVWSINMGTALTAAPTVTRRGVLVPAKDTYLYFLSTNDGSIEWKTLLSKPLSQPAVVAGDQILQSDEGGKIHTLELNGGVLINSENFGGQWVSRPTLREPYWAVVNSTGGCKVYRD
jgi:outer membrane protein assembly factor BamB